MRKYGITILLILSIFQICALAQPADSAKPKQTIKILHPILAEKPPVLDGVLDDPVWKNDPVVDDIFITYNPTIGDVFPQKTHVWMAYDPDNLYFAFYCYDSEPDKIRTSLSKRDQCYGDDWVLITLDAIGNKQKAYEFLVNPSGVQADLLITPDNEDDSPDWVWYSHGKIVNDGWIVEIRIPLKSIRFTSGENVEYNVVFWRYIGRSRVQGSWPALEPGKTEMECATKAIYGKLDAQLKLELMPSITYSSIWDRKTEDNWSDADDVADAGLNLTYGLTSAITLEATINPDFSQIESDEFQVLTNIRYPVFYTEKRPFFMGAGNIFDLAGTSGNNNFITAVNTRTIIDPAWGARITGEIGIGTFGILTASDEWPGKKWDDEINPYEGKNAFHLISRGKVSLGGDNYIGGIYMGRELGEGYNRVIGGDLNIQLAEGHYLKGYYLTSFTGQDAGEEGMSGNAFCLFYRYSDKHLYSEITLEHIDDSFEMGTAFYKRTGITQAQALIIYNIFPEEKITWLKRISPYVFLRYVYDDVTKEDDNFYVFDLTFNMSNGWRLTLDYRYFKEFWAREKFHANGAYVEGFFPLTNWLEIYIFCYYTGGIYYDPSDPFLGDKLTLETSVTFQPTDNFNQDFNYIYQDFSRKSDGTDIYDLHIFRSKTTYQFSKELFLRGIIQYDSYRGIILTDLLASLTVIPGTVLYIGYGSIHEDRYWNENQQTWNLDNPLSEFYQTTQSFFMKASYRYQF